jgi:hypothetical protein
MQVADGETSDHQCYAVLILAKWWILRRRMVIAFEVDERSPQAAYV